MRIRRRVTSLLLTILILTFGAAIVLGQGGTGKLPPPGPRMPPPRKMPPPMRNPPPARTPDLKISERRVRDIIVLDLDGRITAREGGTLLRNAIRRLVREGKGKILLNFAKVGWIDATEVEEMVSTHNSVEKGGGQLKLCSPSKKVRFQLLQGPRSEPTTGLVVLTTDTFEKEQEALASFR